MNVFLQRFSWLYFRSKLLLFRWLRHSSETPSWRLQQFTCHRNHTGIDVWSRVSGGRGAVQVAPGPRDAEPVRLDLAAYPAAALARPLEHVDVSANHLTGPIPRSIGNLTCLKYFYAKQNKLSGSLPEELGQLSALQVWVARREWQREARLWGRGGVAARW